MAKNAHVFSHSPGEAKIYSVDGTAVAAQKSTSVSTADWSVESGSAAVSGEALSSNVATALITTANEGCSVIKIKSALADGQIINTYLKINTKEPDCSGDSDIWD